jgi:F-box domain
MMHRLLWCTGLLRLYVFASSLTPSFVGMDEACIDGEFTEPHFLHLPTEIHEHIIRYCGVSDVATLALVNRFLNNVIRSKSRDFLIAGCQNGKSSRTLV